LFGTRKGAFTGAIDRKGRLMENIFGIVFLDEIAEIPFSTQAKLLLYLDEYKITPEGYDKGAIPVPTSARRKIWMDGRCTIICGRSDIQF
jgi:transcriptional regulator with PAS, ATPase and Fis domain